MEKHTWQIIGSRCSNRASRQIDVFFKKQISNNIKAMLKRYGISREELANKLGITTRTLIKIVNHPNKYSINYLNEVANVIGCNINDFFMPL